MNTNFKTKVVAFYIFLFALVSCLPTLGTPINLVQNGNFKSGFAPWNGLIGLQNNPNTPNGVSGIGGDISQTVSTVSGQLYELTFYAAADLYFGPSLTLNLDLNGQTISTIVTPSYTYNNQINRADQMVWAQYDYMFTASSASTLLEFSDQNTYDFGLAGVSLVQVPDAASTIGLFGISLISLAGFSHIYNRRSLDNILKISNGL